MTPYQRGIWRLKGAIGNLKSLRRAGYISPGQELRSLRELQNALREWEIAEEFRRKAEAKPVGITPE